MVRALAPFRQHCRNCAWRGPAILNQSDAIELTALSNRCGNFRTACPECSGTDLAMERITGVSLLLAKLFGSSGSRYR